jgi:hypothetical protein
LNYLGFSVGYDLTERRVAIGRIADERWVAAIDQDASERPNGQSASSPNSWTSAAGRRARPCWCAASARTAARS